MSTTTDPTVTIGAITAQMLGVGLSEAGWSLQLCLNDIKAGRIDEITHQRLENAIEFIRGVGSDFRDAGKKAQR
jgi:hypothetical protein